MTTSQITDPISLLNKAYSQIPQLNKSITVNNVIDFIETVFGDQAEEIVVELIRAFVLSKGGRRPCKNASGYEHILWCVLENQRRY